MIGVGEFLRGGMYNIGGFDPMKGSVGTGRYEGYSWDLNTPKGKVFGKLSRSAGRGAMKTAGKVAFSAAGPLSAAYSIGTGYADEGWWGAAKWGVAEVLTGGFMAGAMSGGLSGSMGATTAGTVIGSFFGPVGQVIGAGIGATAGGTGLMVGGFALAGVAAGAGGTYLAARGSYELLKAGYGYRQQMQRKIDTAGSTAAFMTKNAYTMRSRAVEAIRSNQLNVKSALGNEASQVHFSAYRKFAGPKMY